MYLKQLLITDNKTTYPANKNNAAKVHVEDEFSINSDTNIKESNHFW